jgi:pimeloyl-ACP methyl ester carboxylesterase
VRQNRNERVAMTEFASAADGTAIAYESLGEGAPVVLVHGFGASRAITWANTNWYQTLNRAGRRLIAIDCRGHGGSGKPHDAASYEEGRMAADITAVLDALGIAQADVMGYSMGGYLAIRLMTDAPQRVRRAILAGVGEKYFRLSRERAEIIAQALLAPDPAAIMDPEALAYRTFCERAGNDLAALAACIRRPRRSIERQELGTIPPPVLVVCGEQDDTSGPPGPLANAFPNGRALVVPRRNHHSTVGDRIYKDAALEFLKTG